MGKTRRPTFQCWMLLSLMAFWLVLGHENDKECQAGDQECTASQKSGQEEEGGSVWKIPKDPKGQARKAAQKAKQGEGTRIQSNLIQDSSVLEYLTDHRLWFECFQNTRGSHTHWFDHGAKPQSWMEHMALEMWKNHPMVSNKEDSIAGYEIWCNILTPEGPLDWHIDKDQIAFQESNGRNVTTPLYGSVWYGYPHSFQGGHLEIVDYDAETMPDDLEPKPHEMERMEADYNRLVIFNASKYHRVSPITSGTRLTLAVNIWKERPRVAYFAS